MKISESSESLHSMNMRSISICSILCSYLKQSLPTSKHSQTRCSTFGCMCVHIQKQFPFSSSRLLWPRRKTRRSTVVDRGRRQARTWLAERYFSTKTCLFSYRPRCFVCPERTEHDVCAASDWINERAREEKKIRIRSVNNDADTRSRSAHMPVFIRLTVASERGGQDSSSI